MLLDCFFDFWCPQNEKCQAPHLKIYLKKVFAVNVKMSRALQMATCIVEVKDKYVKYWLQPYRKDTEPLYHAFMYFFPVSIHSRNVCHCLLFI